MKIHRIAFFRALALALVSTHVDLARASANEAGCAPIFSRNAGEASDWTSKLFKIRKRGDHASANQVESALEEALSKGEVVSVEPWRGHRGATPNVKKVTVAMKNSDGSIELVEAIFKPNHSLRQSVASSWKREVAAYKLDRMIGANVVPVTVEREILGVRGSLQVLVPDAQIGGLPGRALKADSYEGVPELSFLDALMDNRDRSHGNYLIKNNQIYAIDNSDTFTSFTHDSDKYFEGPGWYLPSAPVLERFRTLTFEHLQQELGPYMGTTEIQAILERGRVLIDAQKSR